MFTVGPKRKPVLTQGRGGERRVSIVVDRRRGTETSRVQFSPNRTEPSGVVSAFEKRIKTSRLAPDGPPSHFVLFYLCSIFSFLTEYLAPAPKRKSSTKTVNYRFLTKIAKKFSSLKKKLFFFKKTRISETSFFTKRSTTKKFDSFDFEYPLDFKGA